MNKDLSNNEQSEGLTPSGLRFMTAPPAKATPSSIQNVISHPVLGQHRPELGQPAGAANPQNRVANGSPRDTLSRDGAIEALPHPTKHLL